jgi:hypothetical protein
VKVTEPETSPESVRIGDTPVITGLVKVLFVNVSVVFVPTRVVVASGKDMTLSAVGFANVITVSNSSGVEPSKVIPPPNFTSGLPDEIEEEGVSTGVYLN